MSSIERFISPFIREQFPSFYKEEGPNFIAFMRAYYEWLEQENGAIGLSRSMLDTVDIDRTQEQFIKYFKNTYIQSIPDSAAADKRLMIKNILDLYRSKGSKRAAELLFRLVFNEDIDLYVPNEFIFRPSDNIWVVPRYIEVTFHPRIFELNGTQIQNDGKFGTAIVNGVSEKVVNGRTINVLELTDIKGNFKRGDRIFQTYGNSITSTDGPIITGSLTAVAITSGGSNYRVGDILNVEGSGTEATVRVSNIVNDVLGSVSFDLLSGGSGYSLNAEITVATTLNIEVANSLGTLSVGQSLVDANTAANGTIVTSNGSLLQVINFSESLQFNVGDEVQTSTGNAKIASVVGGVGSGATFRVGGLTNREFANVTTDFISGYLLTNLDRSSNSFDISLSSISGTFSSGDNVTGSANSILIEGIPLTPNTVQTGESLSNSALGISGLFVYRGDVSQLLCTAATDSDLSNANLVPGVILESNTSSSLLQISFKSDKTTVVGNATVEAANSTNVRLSNVDGYFVITSTLTDTTSSATATIDSVQRLTDWGFPTAGIDNLDKPIDQTLTYQLLEVGTIAFLAGINPGSEYLTKPYVRVTEPSVAALGIVDEFGLKGDNAIVEPRIVNARGIVTAVEVINSGYGYLQNESVSLTSANNSTTLNGVSVINDPGKGQGKWLNRRSFPSDVMYIQDSFYYQTFSYEIIARRMLSNYERLVRELIHPSGIALFGRYRLIDIVIGDESSTVESDIIQA